MKIIKDGRTLNALEKAGYIKRIPGFSYVETNESSFIHNGRTFKVRYLDGCFFPFVFEVDQKTTCAAK